MFFIFLFVTTWLPFNTSLSLFGTSTLQTFASSSRVSHCFFFHDLFFSLLLYFAILFNSIPIWISIVKHTATCWLLCSLTSSGSLPSCFQSDARRRSSRKVKQVQVDSVRGVTMVSTNILLNLPHAFPQSKAESLSLVRVICHHRDVPNRLSSSEAEEGGRYGNTFANHFSLPVFVCLPISSKTFPTTSIVVHHWPNSMFSFSINVPSQEENVVRVVLYSFDPTFWWPYLGLWDLQ